MHQRNNKHKSKFHGHLFLYLHILSPNLSLSQLQFMYKQRYEKLAIFYAFGRTNDDVCICMCMDKGYLGKMEKLWAELPGMIKVLFG